MVAEEAGASYHVPVLAREVVRALVTDPDGAYLDATAGGGGHSRALLAALGPRARLLALDRDPEAVCAIAARLGGDGRLQVRQGDFADLDAALEAARIPALTGVLFDLGVSSHQIDAPPRGFSYRAAGPLDMRMDPERGRTAADLVAAASEEELARLLRDYGEERRARCIARAIVRGGAAGPLLSTEDLRAAVLQTRPRMPNKTLARVFQALRIAVNDELGQLTRGLDAAMERLAAGGRIAVIAYHSLEDRIVKRRFAAWARACTCPPRWPVCACGRRAQLLRLGRVRPSAGEVAANSRARSAVLRWGEKIGESCHDAHR